MKSNASTTNAPTYRVSKAAVGKILAGIVTSTDESGMDAEAFRRLMTAACEYMISGTTDEANLPDEWIDVKKLIDKAALRSAKARERATKRKENPESQPVNQGDSGHDMPRQEEEKLMSEPKPESPGTYRTDGKAKKSRPGAFKIHRKYILKPIRKK